MKKEKFYFFLCNFFLIKKNKEKKWNTWNVRKMASLQSNDNLPIIFNKLKI